MKKLNDHVPQVFNDISSHISHVSYVVLSNDNENVYYAIQYVYK